APPLRNDRREAENLSECFRSLSATNTSRSSRDTTRQHPRISDLARTSCVDSRTQPPPPEQPDSAAVGEEWDGCRRFPCPMACRPHAPGYLRLDQVSRQSLTAVLIRQGRFAMTRRLKVEAVN